MGESQKVRSTPLRGLSRPVYRYDPRIVVLKYSHIIDPDISSLQLTNHRISNAASESSISPREIKQCVPFCQKLENPVEARQSVSRTRAQAFQDGARIPSELFQNRKPTPMAPTVRACSGLSIPLYQVRAHNSAHLTFAGLNPHTLTYGCSSARTNPRGAEFRGP
jgi:hypothetical protein